MTDQVAVRPYINVLDPEFYVDPWDAYRWLRDEAPVFWDPVQKLWAVSRYDDIITVERNSGRYSSKQGSRPHLDQTDDQSIINMDDPDHQAQRGLVARRFTPNAVRDHEDHVRRIVTSIIDAVAPLGECDAADRPPRGRRRHAPRAVAPFRSYGHDVVQRPVQGQPRPHRGTHCASTHIHGPVREVLAR